MDGDVGEGGAFGGEAEAGEAVGAVFYEKKVMFVAQSSEGGFVADDTEGVLHNNGFGGFGDEGCWILDGEGGEV